MWTQSFDLHSHSLHSDGEHPVQDVARLMHEEGVKTWSLTDHDTTSGWNEAAKVAASLGMHFLPGVEITCEPALEPDHNHLAAIGRERASASWHLLAYFPEHQPGVNDETVAGFKAWLEPHQDGRLPRMKAMCQRLTELGMPVDVEDVCRRASGSVGRPHLAQAMVELGYVSSKVEAFETWIGDGLPGFVPHVKPTIAEAVEAVRSANGFTSLAHPLYYGVPTQQLVEQLGQLGVDAVEAVHRSHTDAYRFELMNEAVSNGMTITVGSDFHGLSWQARPGNMPLQVVALNAKLNGA
jgi:predicted metal-dependent phosphoesterase TrpH